MIGGFYLKFIFPKNYDFKNKLFGVLDYSTIFINFIWCGIVFIFINLFFNNLTLRIFLFILFCFPFLLISISGFNGESFVYVSIYIIFSFKTKIIFIF